MKRTVLAGLLIPVLFATVAAHARDDRGGYEEVASVIERISGGASILEQLSSGAAAREFRESADRLKGLVDDSENRRRLAREWRRLRESFQTLERERNSTDPRLQFTMRHLGEEMAAGDRLLGRDSSD